MQRVLIIGASRGIGLEFVRQYRAEGSAVTATARRDEDLARLRALGATALQLDLLDAASASALAWQVDGAGFDTVVHNAGVHGPRSRGVYTPTQDDFDQVMRANVLGAMRVLPQLEAEGTLAPGARVAVISSRMGAIASRGNNSSSLYRASKAALNSVLKDAALAWAGRAICVALHPGWVRTDMGGAAADLPVSDSVAALRRTLAALTPAQHGGFFDHDGSPIAW